MTDFPWQALDTEMDEFLTEEDTGAEVRRKISRDLYLVFNEPYNEIACVEIWTLEELAYMFFVRRDMWLGSQLDKAAYLRAQLSHGFGTRQEVYEWYRMMGS
jgi:hypothetical protein